MPLTMHNTSRTDGRITRPSARRRVTPTIWIITFLTPAVLAILLMRVAPAVGAVITSLQTSAPGGLGINSWAGAHNYLTLAQDPGFWQALGQTLLFAAIINPLQVFVALLVAVLLTQRVALRGLWRTLIFIPATVPIVGSSIAWGVALQPKGPVNAIISSLGGQPQPFLTSPTQALGTIILIASWIGIGYWMIFLIAGIEDIPRDYYEAAIIDRAGPIRTFVSVTVPLLRRPLLFVLVADTVANFVLFVPVQLLTNGGPQNSTTMLMFDSYRTTYDYGAAHQGAAEVVVLTLIMLAIVLVQFRLLRDPNEVKP